MRTRSSRSARTSGVTAASAGSRFQSRPFGEARSAPDLRSAEVLGHNLARLPVQTPVQTKPRQFQEERPRVSIRPGHGRPLPSRVREKMEGALGADFSDVRVHEGSEADAAGAVAYTRGSDIHFAPGTFSPGSAEGQRLLGHELAHVVQQREGRVAMPGGGGAPINEDPSLEAEADAMGARAARSRTPASFSRTERPSGPSPVAAGAGPIPAAAPAGAAQLMPQEHKKMSGGRGRTKPKHEKGQRAKQNQKKNINFKDLKKKDPHITKHQADRLRKGKGPR